jgi:ABC-2 type transport system ATP-binding protein
VTHGLLEVSDLRHSYAGTRVLDGVSFHVARGEMLGLLGPNGSGKSTILRALSGLLSPETGTLRIEGVSEAFGGRALRSRMGVVFQSPSVDDRLSVRENLELSARLHRIPAALMPARVDEALSFSELKERAEDRVLQLSGGMKRRLELARALLPEPALLVLDEPTTGLDEGSFRRFWQRIAELRTSRGQSVLLTTHRADEAALCDRVLVIDHGRVVASGTPAELIARVSGDVLTLEASEPEALAQEIAARFSLQAQVVAGRVVVERERGHELIPRLIEALPPGRIASLSMHRPTLADVFVKLTGHSLSVDQEAGKGSA